MEKDNTHNITGGKQKTSKLLFSNCDCATDRKKTSSSKSVSEQSALEQSQNQFDLLYNSLPIGCVLVNTDFSVLDANNSFLELLPNSKVLTKKKNSFLTFFSPSTKKQVENIVLQLSDNNEKKRIEVKLLRQDNSLLCVQLDVYKDSHADVYVFFVTDLSSTKKQSKELEDSISVFSEVFDRNTNGLLWVGKNNVIVKVNASACLILESKEENIINKKYEELFSKYTRSDISNFCLDNFERKKINFKNKQGKATQITISATTIEYKNQLVHQLTIVDTTSQYEAKKRVEQIIDLSPLAIYMSTGLEQKAVYMNATFERLFGYTEEEIPSVKEWWPLAYPDTDYRNHLANEWNREVKKAIATSSEIPPIETIVTCKDGTTKNIIWGYISTGLQNWAFGYDITNQRIAETLSLESERRFQVLSESTFESIFISKNGVCVDQNKAAEVMFGYTLNEAKGKLVLDWIQEDYHSLVRANIQDDLSSAYRCLARRKDGTVFWAEIQARSVNAKGEKLRITALRNISIQKEKEEALMESEMRYRVLSDLTFEGIIIHNKGITIEVNLAFCQMSGYSAQELIGSNIISKMVHPDDLLVIQEKMQQRVTESYQVRAIKNDGTIFIVEIEAKAIILNKEEMRVAAVRDVTQRVKHEQILLESERRTKQIIEKMPMSIIIFDKNTEKIRYLNTKFTDTFGFTTQDISTLQDWWNTTESTTELQNTLRQKWESAKSENIEAEVFEPEEIYMRCKKNIRKFIRTHAHVVGNTAIITLVDLTQIKRISEKLEDTSATKDKFMSILGHDLRSPFNTLLGFSSLLLKHLDVYDKKKIKLFVKNINTVSQNTLDLLNNLLLWSRSQQHRIPFIPKKINLLELLKENQEYVQNSAEEKQITILLDVEPHIEIDVDVEMIKTVLRNILGNAVKFTPENGIIHVAAKQFGDKVHIDIMDTGVGMDEKYRKTLFKIGEVNTQRGTNGERGTGFGLLLCKDFIDYHSGKLIVESTLGEGSKFIIELPIDQKAIEEKLQVCSE